MHHSLIKLEEYNLIENIENFSEFSKSGKNYYKFKSFSETMLNDLKENESMISKVKEYLKIDLSKEGKFILDTEDKNKNFLDLI